MWSGYTDDWTGCLNINDLPGGTSRQTVARIALIVKGPGQMSADQQIPDGYGVGSAVVATTITCVAEGPDHNHRWKGRHHLNGIVLGHVLLNETTTSAAAKTEMDVKIMISINLE